MSILCTKTREVPSTLPSSTGFNTFLRRLVSGSKVVQATEAISWSSRGRNVSNQCTHTCSENVYPEQVQVQHRSRVYGVGGVTDSYATFIPNISERPLVDRTSDTGNFAFERERAITDVLSGGIKPLVDVPLFIAELKDSKMLLSTLVKGAQDVMYVRNLIKSVAAVRALDRAGRPLTKAQVALLNWEQHVWKFGQMTLKDAADVNLWWQFGIAPLKSDIPKLWRCLNKTEIAVRIKSKPDGKIRQDLDIGTNVIVSPLVNGYDKTLLWTATATTAGSPVVNSADRYSSAPSQTWLDGRQFKYNRHKYTVYGRLVCPQLKGWDAIKQGLHLGAGGALSVGYAVIPFSFIIDRFLAIGAFLKETNRRLKALDLSLGFYDGVWESYEVSNVVSVPWWTFTGSDLTVVSRTSTTATYKDRYWYRWAGWRDIHRASTYNRRPLVGLQPKVVMKVARLASIRSLFNISTDLALLSKFIV